MDSNMITQSNTLRLQRQREPGLKYFLKVLFRHASLNPVLQSGRPRLFATPAWALLLWSVGYAMSGPVAYLIGLLRRKGDGGNAPSVIDAPLPAPEPSALTS